MLYLLIQTSVLLSICAIVFFGVGWMAHRWIEKRDPWRAPASPKKSDPDAMEALQANLRQVSDQLSERNLALQATRQTLQETERKWQEHAQRSSELEVQLEEALKMQPAVVELVPQSAPVLEQIGEQVIEQPIPQPEPANEGIAAALREQLQNLEARNEELKEARANAQATAHEKQRIVDEQQLAIEDHKRKIEQLGAELQTLVAEKRRIETERSGYELERQRSIEEKKALAWERDQLAMQLAAVSNAEDRNEWAQKIEAWEKQLAQPIEVATDRESDVMVPSLPEIQPEAAPITLAPIGDSEIEIDDEESEEALDAELVEPVGKILERMERLEQQWGEHALVSTRKEDELEQDLKKRLLHLEDTMQNLRAESEMALLAQLEFQARALDSESEERQRWDDLEHELEMRITQLERELASVRQAEHLVSEIGDQVETKLKQQLESLASEVTQIKNSWNHQEEEFKTRDTQILGNLDRLQESLAKLGVKIAEEDSVPDSMLKEMDALRGDILASIPLAPTTSLPVAEEESSSTVEEIRQVRGRFERASENLQHLLEEKDKTIRMLDKKVQAMAKKLDPTLVGKDDLELIKGIGPYIKRVLEKEFGISSFKQIALLNPSDMEKISSRLFFKNKIQKEDWIGQAIELHQKKYDEQL